MRDQIVINGMSFVGRHGVLPHEKVIRQPFVVDLVVYLDLRKAAEVDDLSCTLDYSQVFETVREVVEDRSYNLLEALAEAICRRVMDRWPVNGVRVRVKKPEAPLGGHAEYVAVEIRRWRRH